jgi:hypothetical protein
LDVISTNCREGLPWELLYADDLVLIAESEGKLVQKIRVWKDSFESMGLKVNTSKSKVMKCPSTGGVASGGTGKYPCSVCSKGVGRNSILCQKCKKWTHKKCSGVKGKLKEGMTFICNRCCGMVVTQQIKTELEKTVLSQGVELERVEKFCYLGDMLGANGGAEEAVRMRVRCAWAKFRQLIPVLTTRGASLRLRGRIYESSVRSVMTYGSETWPLRVEDEDRLVRTENSMLRWMCGVTLKDRIKTEKLREQLGIVGVDDCIRRGRLRWFGHVERKAETDWTRACQSLMKDVKKGRGRGRKTWEQCVKCDLKQMNLKREDTADRDEWRRKIHGGNVQPVRAQKR